MLRPESGGLLQGYWAKLKQKKSEKQNTLQGLKTVYSGFG